MTNHTDLIARLRKDDLFWEAPITCRSEAADVLEAAQAEIERLTTDRRVLQADGKHPAPCAKFCEATAFTIELRRAHAEIEKLREVWLEDGVRASEDRGDLLKERDQALAEIDMHMRVATNAIDHVVTLKAEIEAQQHRIQALWMERDVLRTERDQALARLAAMEAQEPVGIVSETWAHWPDKGNVVVVDWVKDTPPVGASIYAAAGASPVQPSQAGELSDVTILKIATQSKVPTVVTNEVVIQFARNLFAAINAKETDRG